MVRVLTSAPRAKARFLGVALVISVVAAIALSCTDSSGQWCGRTFDQGFRYLFGAGASARVYLTIRLIAEKSVHLTLYIGLSGALWVCSRRVRHRTICALTVGFAIGVCSELFQMLFPTRDPAVRDVLINWSGIVTGLSLIHIVKAFSTRTVAPLVSSEPELGHANSTGHDLLALAARLHQQSSSAPVASESNAGVSSDFDRVA